MGSAGPEQVERERPRRNSILKYCSSNCAPGTPGKRGDTNSGYTHKPREDDNVTEKKKKRRGQVTKVKQEHLVIG